MGVAVSIGVGEDVLVGEAVRVRVGVPDGGEGIGVTVGVSVTIREMIIVMVGVDVGVEVSSRKVEVGVEVEVGDEVEVGNRVKVGVGVRLEEDSGNTPGNELPRMAEAASHRTRVEKVTAGITARNFLSMPLLRTRHDG